MKKIFVSFILFLLLLVAIVFIVVNRTKPSYSGEISLHGLEQEVLIKYDEFGIPHIYATNESDAYFALGYVHAQERLFQMEMIRRVATGTLSEILGPDLIKTDKLFRTLGINQKAKEMANRFNESALAYKPAAEAYFSGINAFIETGPTPIEFTLIGIPKQKFEIVDAYNAAGFMSFGFAEGFKVDPIASKISVKYGNEYLEDLGLHSLPDSTYIPSYFGSDSVNIIKMAEVIDIVPIPLFIGSNGWVIGGSKTESGKPIFENDTHIGFSQPSVWFEAHLNYPGTNYYGHYLAGFPFGLLGHNEYSAIGLTMFENDDVDLFIEKINPQDSSQIWRKDRWEPLKFREETIYVKDEEPINLVVRESDHGPIINDVFLDEGVSNHPVAAWWAFLHAENDLFKAVHGLNHSKSMADSRAAVSKIEAPGLNVMYADIDGNIGWWAAARIPIRPGHVNSKLLLDGSSGEDDYLGFYDFEQNPQAENPPWGFVYSANNQPDSINGVLYPGYYMPMDRAKVITEALEASNNWNLQAVKEMTGNVISPVHPLIAAALAKALTPISNQSSQQLIDLLSNWDGNHSKELVEPAIYYTLLSWVLYNAMADELGSKDYSVFATSSLMKRSYLMFVKNDNSIWWDNIHTPQKESRSDIIELSLNQTITTLIRNMESDEVATWHWEKIHTLTHNHPLGKVEALKKYFSVGPFKVDGGNEVLNNLMFNLDTTGVFNVKAGPAVRTVIDMANISGAESINPTGQSGHLLSKHYQDQAQMFVDVRFRPQLMDSVEVNQHWESTLKLLPTN